MRSTNKLFQKIENKNVVLNGCLTFIPCFCFIFMGQNCEINLNTNIRFDHKYYYWCRDLKWGQNFLLPPFKISLVGDSPPVGVWCGTNLYHSIILISESYLDKIICFSNTLN